MRNATTPITNQQRHQHKTITTGEEIVAKNTEGKWWWIRHHRYKERYHNPRNKCHMQFKCILGLILSTCP